LGLQLLEPWRMWLVWWSITQRVIQGMAHGINKEMLCDSECQTAIDENRELVSNVRSAFV
jgi:hypothetical protein